MARKKNKQRAFDRIKASIEEVLAGKFVLHEFDVRNAGDREVIIHKRNGVPDPVPTIRPKKK